MANSDTPYTKENDMFFLATGIVIFIAIALPRIMYRFLND